jgi:hypothetical protein
MGAAKQKGDLLEDVAALLLERKDAKIDKRIKIPVADPRSNRTREIDVLLTSYIDIDEYPIRIAIECKNEKDKVGVEKIDAFFGKLHDVGIPTQHGIYVSPTGYTKGALERAKADGIRTLIIEGLTADRLSIEIYKARQSMVYLALTWEEMYRFKDEADYSYDSCKKLPAEIVIEFNIERYGHGMPGILNAIWEKWRTGEMSSTLGKHSIAIILPEGYQFDNDQSEKYTSLVIVKCKIFGFLFKMAGSAKDFILKDAETGKLEKRNIKAEFSKDSNMSMLGWLESEEALSQHISLGGIHVYGRIKIPRIITSRCYWPPSKRAVQRIRELYDSKDEITFGKVEGSNLHQAWEDFEKTETNSDNATSDHQ